jgi:hypothetical protein
VQSEEVGQDSLLILARERRAGWHKYRRRPRWFRADLVVSSLRRDRGPSSLRDGLFEATTKEVLMKRFEVYEMALQMVHVLRPAVERIRLHDRDLALQLKRAGSSVPGNIAEGARRAGRIDFTTTESPPAPPEKSAPTLPWPWLGVTWTKPPSRPHFPCSIPSSRFSGA